MMLPRLKSLSLALMGGMFAALAMMPLQSASAQDSGLDIELNKLADEESGCSAYLVFNNTSDKRYSSYQLDLFLLDGEGIIQRRLTVEAAPLRAKKTSIKVFTIPEQKCESIGRVMLNDITACKSGDAMMEDCIDSANVSSRTSAEFVK